MTLQRNQFGWLCATILSLALLPARARGQGDECARLTTSKVECIPGEAGRYLISFQVENASKINVDRLFLFGQMPGLVLSPDEFLFPPVAPGGVSEQLTLVLEADPTVTPPVQCFEATIHDSHTGECCARAQICPQLDSCAGGPVFHRGDADGNGELQLTDAIRILGFLFLGSIPPVCFDAADSDDNGELQLTDAIRILGYLFLGQAPPAPPGPPGEACGSDPNAEAPDLGCADYRSC